VQEASESLLLEETNEIEGLLMGPHGLDEITAEVPAQLPAKPKPSLKHVVLLYMPF
jgi:hypothetical protein